MTTPSVRIGLIGIGNIGSAHLRWMLEHPVSGLSVAALCDIDPQKRELLRREAPGIPVFATHEEMLASGLTEAVIVAAPHEIHPIAAVDAFRAGQHVLIEKPAGVSVRSVRRMNEEAEKSGKVFAIMFNQRTNPLFARAREIVQSGQLGVPKRLAPTGWKSPAIAAVWCSKTAVCCGRSWPPRSANSAFPSRKASISRKCRRNASPRPSRTATRSFCKTLRGRSCTESH